MKWQSTETIKNAVGQILVTDGTEVFVIYTSWLYRTENGDLRAPARHGNGVDVKWWSPIPELPQ